MSYDNTLFYENITIIGCIIAGISLFSCTKHSTETDNPPSVIKEIRAAFDAKADRTKSSHDMFAPGAISPNWDGAILSERIDAVNADIPISAGRKYTAVWTDSKPKWITLPAKSRINESHSVTTTLEPMTVAVRTPVPVSQKIVAVKNNVDAKISLYVLTLIPTVEYFEMYPDEAIRQFISIGEKSDFSGIAVYTTLDGIPVRVSEYKNGIKCRGVFLGKSQGEQRQQKIQQAQEIIGKIRFREILPQTRDGDDWMNMEIYCMSCGEFHTPKNACKGITITPDGPAEETVDPEEPHIDPIIPGGGNTGGGGSGGGSSGGGSGGGGSGAGLPTAGQITGARITTAVTKSVTEMTKLHGTTKAVCNFGVRYAFESVYNSTELRNKRANEMVRHWETSSKWEQVTISQAQGLANKGWFVVAGWIDPAGGSGHVVVVVPGTAVTKEWNKTPIPVPNVMDTGAKKRFTSSPITDCFGKPKHANVKFFKYK